MGKVSYMEKVRNEHNESILKNIAKNGLHIEIDGAPNVGRINSNDHEHDNRICYFYVTPQRSREETMNPVSMFMSSLSDPFKRNHLQELQHRQIDGLWSLVLERQCEPFEQLVSSEWMPDLFEWEDRLSHSILLVLKCSPQRIREDKLSPTSDPFEIKDYSSIKTFERSDILKVLCPSSQCESAVAVFGTSLVSVVGDTTVVHRPLKTGESMHGGTYLVGPDYAATLHSLIKKNAFPYPFALHVVRLATRRDCLKIPMLSKRLTKEALETTFLKPPTPDALLRRAVNFGQREDLEYTIKLIGNNAVNGYSEKEGLTALDYAINNKDIPMIKTLLANGANVKSRSLTTRQTSEDRAKEKGIFLDEISSGKYEKKIHIERMKADPSMKEMASFLGDDFDFDRMMTSGAKPK